MKKILSIALLLCMVLMMAVPAMAEKTTVRIGMVTDVGGVNDKSFNQTSWEGLQALAAEDSSFEVNYLESKTDADYQTNINTFIDEGYDLIICVGYMLADATREAAEENPDQLFAIIDDSSIDLPNVAVTGAIVADLKAEMRRIVAADMPIARISVSTEDARDYFTRTGQTDRLRILGYRRFSHFTLYRIDGLEDYFYGEMVPATGCLGVFDLRAYGEGILLQLPDVNDPKKPAPTAICRTAHLRRGGPVARHTELRKRGGPERHGGQPPAEGIHPRERGPAGAQDPADRGPVRRLGGAAAADRRAVVLGQDHLFPPHVHRPSGTRAAAGEGLAGRLLPGPGRHSP